MNECSICLEYTTEEDFVILNCKHIFHEECIRVWTKGTCPMCRETYSENNSSDKVTQQQFYYGTIPDVAFSGSEIRDLRRKIFKFIHRIIASRNQS